MQLTYNNILLHDVLHFLEYYKYPNVGSYTLWATEGNYDGFITL